MIGLILRSRNGIVCSVHEHADHEVNVMDRAEGLRFVREGFSWAVALLAPFVLLLRGAWLALALYLVLATAISFVMTSFGATAMLTALAILALGIVFGFEAAAIERLSLSLLGWEEVGVVGGADMEECERRFFDAWLAEKTAKPLPAAAAPAPVQTSTMLRRLFAARP